MSDTGDTAEGEGDTFQSSAADVQAAADQKSDDADGYQGGNQNLDLLVKTPDSSGDQSTDQPGDGADETKYGLVIWGDDGDQEYVAFASADERTKYMEDHKSRVAYKTNAQPEEWDGDYADLDPFDGLTNSGLHSNFDPTNLSYFYATHPELIPEGERDRYTLYPPESELGSQRAANNEKITKLKRIRDDPNTRYSLELKEYIEDVLGITGSLEDGEWSDDDMAVIEDEIKKLEDDNDLLTRAQTYYDTHGYHTPKTWEQLVEENKNDGDPTNDYSSEVIADINKLIELVKHGTNLDYQKPENWALLHKYGLADEPPADIFLAERRPEDLTGGDLFNYNQLHALSMDPSRRDEPQMIALMRLYGIKLPSEGNTFWLEDIDNVLKYNILHQTRPFIARGRRVNDPMMNANIKTLLKDNYGVDLGDGSGNMEDAYSRNSHQFGRHRFSSGADGHHQTETTLVRNPEIEYLQDAITLGSSMFTQQVDENGNRLTHKVIGADGIERDKPIMVFKPEYEFYKDLFDKYGIDYTNEYGEFTPPSQFDIQDAEAQILSEGNEWIEDQDGIRAANGDPIYAIIMYKDANGVEQERINPEYVKAHFLRGDVWDPVEQRWTKGIMGMDDGDGNILAYLSDPESGLEYRANGEWYKKEGSDHWYGPLERTVLVPHIRVNEQGLASFTYTIKKEERRITYKEHIEQTLEEGKLIQELMFGPDHDRVLRKMKDWAKENLHLPEKFFKVANSIKNVVLRMAVDPEGFFVGILMTPFVSKEKMEMMGLTAADDLADNYTLDQALMDFLMGRTVGEASGHIVSSATHDMKILRSVVTETSTFKQAAKSIEKTTGGLKFKVKVLIDGVEREISMVRSFWKNSILGSRAVRPRSDNDLGESLLGGYKKEFGERDIQVQVKKSQLGALEMKIRRLQATDVTLNAAGKRELKLAQKNANKLRNEILAIETSKGYYPVVKSFEFYRPKRLSDGSLVRDKAGKVVMELHKAVYRGSDFVANVLKRTLGVKKGERIYDRAGKIIKQEIKSKAYQPLNKQIDRFLRIVTNEKFEDMTADEIDDLSDDDYYAYLDYQEHKEPGLYHRVYKDVSDGVISPNLLNDGYGWYDPSETTRMEEDGTVVLIPTPSADGSSIEYLPTIVGKDTNLGHGYLSFGSVDAIAFQNELIQSYCNEATVSPEDFDEFVDDFNYAKEIATNSDLSPAALDGWFSELIQKGLQPERAERLVSMVLVHEATLDPDKFMKGDYSSETAQYLSDGFDNDHIKTLSEIKGLFNGKSLSVTDLETKLGESGFQYDPRILPLLDRDGDGLIEWNEFYGTIRDGALPELIENDAALFTLKSGQTLGEQIGITNPREREEVGGIYEFLVAAFKNAMAEGEGPISMYDLINYITMEDHDSTFMDGNWMWYGTRLAFAFSFENIDRNSLIYISKLIYDTNAAYEGGTDLNGVWNNFRSTYDLTDGFPILTKDVDLSPHIGPDPGGLEENETSRHTFISGGVNQWILENATEHEQNLIELSHLIGNNESIDGIYRWINQTIGDVETNEYAYYLFSMCKKKIEQMSSYKINEVFGDLKKISFDKRMATPHDEIDCDDPRFVENTKCKKPDVYFDAPTQFTFGSNISHFGVF